jgi:hypothetical protein
MVRNWLYGIAAALCAIAMMRILFLLLFRKPVRARTCGTDLSEMQRCYDGEMHQAARFDGLPTADDIPVRGVLARVAYEVDGAQYRSDVCLVTAKGDQADATPLVWYDPAYPSRATGFGLGSAMAGMLLGAAFAVLAYRWPL